MAHDIIIHGDFVQFNGTARCAACQAKDLKCALQQSDEGCMACAGASRECIFSRYVVVSGPKANFDWSILLNRGRGPPAVPLMTPAPSEATAATSPFSRGFDRARQIQENTMGRAMAQHSPVLLKDRPNTTQRVLTRSLSPPETEESRSRTGVDPMNRNQLGEISSLAEQTAWGHKDRWLPTPQRSENMNGSLVRTWTSRFPSQQLGTMQQTAPMHKVAHPKFSYEKPERDAHAGLLPERNLNSMRNYHPVQPSRDGNFSGPSSANTTLVNTAKLDRDVCKTEIRNLSPRLPDYLLERLVQEQLRRFDSLSQLKFDHIQMRHQEKCPSGPHCLDDRSYSRWLETAHDIKSRSRSPVRFMEPSDTSDTRTNEAAQLRQPSPSDQGGHDAETAEYSIGPSAFPPGYPVPPNHNFPAAFECPLCFRVKKYHKPSEWVKHVHEDIQPFVCTFEHCSEPKSFKRKADWVRHENERHRQLEWWVCNLQDCSHKCFRKDNFVQHLVREHKLPEPRPRPFHASATPENQEKQPAANNAAEDPVWKLVETCFHETQKSPEEECCRFCGHVCTSWKKLTVHLAKHLEDIAIPIWKTVIQSDLAPKSTISPLRSQSTTREENIIHARDNQFVPVKENAMRSHDDRYVPKQENIVHPHEDRYVPMDITTDVSPRPGRIPLRCTYEGCTHTCKDHSEFKSVSRHAI
ncbi:MAG: hypothetical protein Q9191_006460 [Dirinaria sp. TL-2023a]